MANWARMSIIRHWIVDPNAYRWAYGSWCMINDDRLDIEAMIIRPEAVTDYAAIADLHVRAFGRRAGEALIVALLRQRRSFDPALSLVAEREGRLVGHALFSPHQMRLLGQSVPVVTLAPLSVDPSCQRQGIGGQLIAAGHGVAAAQGYVLRFLLGHPSYYPRFGYRTGAYGAAQATVPLAALSGAPRDRLEGHGPTPALRAL
jgi:predicted N-acetyltransferase YhbS